MLEVEIRPASDADLNLVRKSWMRSYRKSRAMEWVSDADYDASMPLRIQRILSDLTTRVTIASPAGDTMTAFGFIVVGPGVLHYVWTKEAWRRQGVAKQLFDAAFAGSTPRITHVTRMGESLWRTAIPAAHYDPFGIP